MASDSIAHSAFYLMGYWLRTHSGSRNNKLLIIQVGTSQTFFWPFYLKGRLPVQLRNTKSEKKLKKRDLIKKNHLDPSSSLQFLKLYRFKWNYII